MDNKIDLDAIYKDLGEEKKNHWLDTETFCKLYAKEVARQALVLASEKARILSKEVYNERHGEYEYIPYVDKQSILAVNDLVV